MGFFPPEARKNRRAGEEWGVGPGQVREKFPGGVVAFIAPAAWLKASHMVPLPPFFTHVATRAILVPHASRDAAQCVCAKGKIPLEDSRHMLHIPLRVSEGNRRPFGIVGSQGFLRTGGSPPFEMKHGHDSERWAEASIRTKANEGGGTLKGWIGMIMDHGWWNMTFFDRAPYRPIHSTFHSPPIGGRDPCPSVSSYTYTPHARFPEMERQASRSSSPFLAQSELALLRALRRLHLHD